MTTAKADSTTPVLTARGEIVTEEWGRTALSDAPREAWAVKVYWASDHVKIDRPTTYSIVTGSRKLAERLKRAVDAQAVFRDPELCTDVNGHTYVHSPCLVMGRRLNADLRKLGY